MKKEVTLPLSNYYGTVIAYEVKESGKYFMSLDDHNSTDTVEISKQLFKALVKDFGYSKEN